MFSRCEVHFRPDFVRFFLFLAILSSNFSASAKQKPLLNQLALVDSQRVAIFNLNHWSYWQSVSYPWGWKPATEMEGGIYPQGTATVIFSDGFAWGGFIRDGRTPALRVGGTSYKNGMQAGWIETAGDGVNPPVAVDSNDVRARIYKIRPDYQQLSVSDTTVLREAAEWFDMDQSRITPPYAQFILDRYARDWQEWPGDLGAPFIDNNGNGQWDPGVDAPGLPDAGQVIWFVANDLDAQKIFSFAGSPPMGLEIQVTLWGYMDGTANEDAVYKRVRFINKSGFPIDSMFMSIWSDADIGNFSDDLAGCDSVQSFGTIYNGFTHDELFNLYGILAPAIGYALLQGPAVPAGGNFNNSRQGLNFLPMTSFYPNASGDVVPSPALSNYDGTLQWYDIMNGYIPGASPGTRFRFRHGAGPNKGKETGFPLNGDPFRHTGDIDGVPDNSQPGDRMMILNSGPFTMAAGDTQDVVYALVGGITPGGDNTTVYEQTKLNMQTVRFFYSKNVTAIKDSGGGNRISDFRLLQNYPNPFNPSTAIRFTLPKRESVSLKVYDVLGRKVATLLNGQLPAGDHRVKFDGQNLPSGVYFYRLRAGNFVKTRKMLLLR